MNGISLSEDKLDTGTLRDRHEMRTLFVFGTRLDLKHWRTHELIAPGETVYFQPRGMDKVCVTFRDGSQYVGIVVQDSIDTLRGCEWDAAVLHDSFYRSVHRPLVEEIRAYIRTRVR